MAWSANRSGCLVIGMVRDGKELYVRETREGGRVEGDCINKMGGIRGRGKGSRIGDWSEKV